MRRNPTSATSCWVTPTKRRRLTQPTPAAANTWHGSGMGRSAFPHVEIRQAGAALITSLVFLTILTILGMSSLGTALLESRMAGNARDRNLAFQAAETGLRDAELWIRDSGRIVGINEEGYDTAATCTPSSGTCDSQTCKHGLCYNGGSMEVGGSASAWYMADRAVWQDADKWDRALQYADSAATPVSVPGLASAGGRKVVSYKTGATRVVISSFNINCGQIPGNCRYSQPAPLPLVRRQPEYLIEAYEKNIGGLRYYYRITVRGYGMRSGTRVMVQEVYSP